MSGDVTVKALVIKSDGEVLVEMVPKDSLARMQEVVGGFIQALPVPPAPLGNEPEFAGSMYFNEEGKYENLPKNDIATALMIRNLYPGDCIVGNAMVFGPLDDGADTDVPDAIVERVRSLVEVYGKK